MTESRSVPVGISRRWMVCAVTFATALTITSAALRGSDGDVVVTVDDGIETVTEGLSTTYRVMIHNNTEQQLDRIEVTLTTPASLALGRPGGGGPAQTTWQVDVAPDATAQVEVGAAVGSISAGAEITVIACASAGDLPVTCGADIDRAATAVKAESDVPWWTTLTMWWQFLLAAPGVLPVVLLIAYAACRPFRRGGGERDRRESP